MVEKPFEQDKQMVSGSAIRDIIPVADFGASFEARFTRHSGIESGVYYRNILRPSFTYKSNYPVTTTNEVHMPKQFSHYISIPILYKFYSKILNASAGINYSRLIEQTSKPNPERDRAKDNLGILVKISKDIRIYKRLLVEPFLQYEYEVEAWPASEYNHRMNWFGGGVGIKYVFVKPKK